MGNKKRNNNTQQKQNKGREHKKLTVDEIITYCKDELGITFNIMSEESAKTFLQKNNYFFRLKQYAETWTERTSSGKYVRLDFGHLVELSTIDMFFRKYIFKMTIDLEHFLKVKIVNDCQNNECDDGYQVVDAYFEKCPWIKDKIQKEKKLTEYSGYDSDEYKVHPAVWNMAEMLTFNDFIYFFSFYYDYFHLKCEYTKQFESIRRLRNASAHNVCILCNFTPFNNFSLDYETYLLLSQANIGMSPTTISQLLRVPVLNDFAVMLHLYTRLCTSNSVKEKTLEELSNFFDDRVVLHKDYFEGCTAINNAYTFARAIIRVFGGK